MADWEPSPANRACGFAGRDLKTASGEWMDRGAATTAADARTLWAGLVRDALEEDDAGGRARARLRTTLELMPSVAADPHARNLVADLIERGRAVIEDREPGVTRPQMRAWYLELQREISIATANQTTGMAGALFRWATWQDPAWINASPVEKIGRDAAPGRRVFYTPEEETAFVAWADANGFVDVADCFTICLWTGARQIDVAALDEVSDLLRST